MNEYEYKEDSTKGKALMIPKKYKGDALVQAWLDSRIVAMLSIWLDSNGRTTRYLSDVVKFVMEEVAEHLVASGEMKKIEFTAEARDILRGKYRIELNPGERGKNNLLHNLTLDSRRKKAFGGHEMPAEESTATSVESTSRLDEIEEALRKARMEEWKESKARTKEQLKTQFKYDENGIVIKEPSPSATWKIVQEKLASGEFVIDEKTGEPRPKTEKELRSEAQQERRKRESSTARSRTTKELDEIERQVAEDDRIQMEKERNM